MTRSWRLVYELNGTRGVLFYSTLSKSGARQLFTRDWPAARVVRMSEMRP